MLLHSLLLLLSNAVTLRRDKSTLYNRVTIIILTSTFTLYLLYNYTLYIEKNMISTSEFIFLDLFMKIFYCFIFCLFIYILIFYLLISNLLHFGYITYLYFIYINYDIEIVLCFLFLFIISILFFKYKDLFQIILAKHHYLIYYIIIITNMYFTISTYLFCDLFLNVEYNYILIMNFEEKFAHSKVLSGYDDSSGLDEPRGSVGPSRSGGPSGSGGPNPPHTGILGYITMSHDRDTLEQQHNTLEQQHHPVEGQHYDPKGNVPPKNYKELYQLMEHRVAYQFNVRGAGNVSVNMAFSKQDDIINKIVKEMLFAYIFDHKEELPIAYRDLNIGKGNPFWGKIYISTTSPIMRSLKSFDV